MDFTQRMLERNRSRLNKSEAKEALPKGTTPLNEVKHNTVTTIASTVDLEKGMSGSNTVTIETKVTMLRPTKSTGTIHSFSEKRDTKDENSCTDPENESTDEKENDQPQEPEDHCPLRHNTKSKLNRLGVLYSDDPSSLSSPLQRTEDTFVVEEEPGDRSQRRPVDRQRAARLARLADTINHWEDDVRNNPVQRSSSKSPVKTSVLTKHTIYADKKYEQHRKFTSKGNDALPYETFSMKTSTKNNAHTETTGQATTKKPGCSILKRPSDRKTYSQCSNGARSTKNIAWDKTVIDALEAQGFSRTESEQRIIYDYNEDDQDEKELSKSNTSSKVSPVKSHSLVKQTSPIKSQSAIRTPSPVKHLSPVKDISPEKGLSSKKPFSPARSVSPVKGRYGSPIQMGVATSRVLEAPPTSTSSSDEDAHLPTMGVAQLRSPRKVTSGSVLDRAAHYERSTSPTKRGARDPAELPLAERLALFERNAGVAVLPKAPFGMPVPSSKLQSNNSSSGIDRGRTATLKRPQNLPVAGPSSSVHDRLTAFENEQSHTTKEHMKGILSERQREMEMLKHRWDRHRSANDQQPPNFEPSAPPLTPPLPPPMPSPPQEFEYSRRHDGYYYNEEEEQTLNIGKTPSQQKKPENAYPVLKEVKKIKLSPPKPGNIYPCLSDMEVESSEVQESDEKEDSYNRSSSSEASIESDINSLGQDIVRISQSSLKRDWNTTDQSASERQVIKEIDDFLDEALEDDSSDEATPPKRRSYAQIPSVQSTSFEYSQSVEVDVEPNQPLIHTVSFYRKQQNMTLKPSSQMRHVQLESTDYSTDDSIERMEEELDRELKLVEAKIDMLQQEVRKQQNIISQSSQALNLCYSTIEFSGSTEQVEAEKLLLLASQRRQAALHEIQRLRVEQTVRPHAPGNKALTEQGSITISNIKLPLKMDVVQRAAKDDECYHLVCLVHCEDRVLSTDVVCAPKALHHHNWVTFPGTLTLDNVYSNFKCTVEVYTLVARSKELIPHDVKYHINTNKKEASKLRLTPRKGKGESRLQVPVVQSPGGPSAVRTSAFNMAGYVIFSSQQIRRKQFTLNKNAYTSALEGTVHLQIDSEVSVDVEYRSFLTMFEDVSGFGAWHRRWCLLKGDTLSYWKYPDDETKKFPLDTIELSACTTTEVDIVPRDVCARPNTFLLETTRPAQSTDIDSLVLVRNGNQTTIRHLLSADTKEERIKWCQHLNKTLALMKGWGASSSK